ncbi:unnamed protein product [Gulo gulo]|uniref:Uncharacterized protein n=1 Tax=Gulo gulo TaxID=48420 RepID=A0A9X9M6E2_GULGU|nr:unnamed protein product [Gulo gulo]
MVGNKTLRERVVLSINYKQMPAKITRVDEITSCTQFGSIQTRLKYISTLDFLLLDISQNNVESCKYCCLHDSIRECRLSHIEVAICQTTGVL